VSFNRYLEISLGKQQLGIPASIALAYAAGWDERKRRAVARMLVGVWLGLQLHDDVVDWQDDLRNGGAWALAIARGIGLQEDTQPVTHRRIVEGSGALVRMLVASSRYFADARRLARIVGTRELESWAVMREAQVRELSMREASSPGFTVRAHKLAPWAKVIFS